MLTLLCFSLSFSARAQDREASDETAPPAASSPETEAIEVVVTGTRTAESAQRSTLHTGVVSREEARRRGATSVAGALEGEPGLQVNPNAYGYLGSPAGVMMQGLDAERVLVLRDGERIVGDLGGVIDLDQFSIEDVERVEYVLGPTSSLYGTGALGGVVNIITAGPSDEGLSGRTRVQTSDLPQHFGAASAGYRRGPHWVTAAGSYRLARGVRLFADRPDYALAPNRRWELSTRAGIDDRDVSTTFELGLFRGESDGLQTQAVPGLGNYIVDLPDHSQRVRARVRQRYRLSDAVELRASTNGELFMGESKKDRRDSRLDELRKREHRLLSAELMTTIADGPRTWVAGVRVEQEDFEQQLRKTEFVSGEVLTNRTAEVSPVSLGSAAAYAQVAWQLGERWTLLPGTRAELHRRFGSVIAPRFALAYRPSDAWVLRASVGRGFRAPSAKEYGFLFDHSFLGYRVIGNSELEPETSWGVNADASVRLTPHIRLRVAAFRNWVRSLIATDYVGRASLGVDDYSYVNVGRASTMGGDVSVEFRISARLRSQIAYSYLRTRNEDIDRPLASRPAHTVLSALIYSPWSNSELSVRNRLVSNAYVSDGVWAPGFVKLDVRAAHNLGQHFQAFAGVSNALDVRDDPLRPGDQRPIVGRSYVVGLNAEF